LQADVAKMGETITRIADNQRAAPAPGSPQPQAPPKPDAKTMEAEFWKNPLGMTQAIAQAAVAQAANQPQAGQDTLVDVARKAARERDPKIFDLLRVEIEAKVGNMPPQYHQSSSVWNNAFNMAVGENMEKVIAERSKGAAPPPAPGGTPSGPSLPSPRAPHAPPEEKLTDDELAFIKKFNISPEGFRRGKKAYDEQDGDPTKPSSWDSVITFDSEQAKRRKRELALKEKK
jgi:hypothetical protein